MELKWLCSLLAAAIGSCCQMATLEAVPPVQAETPGGASSPNDGVLLHPYLFPQVIKAPLQLSPSLRKQLAKQCNSKQGEEFIAELDQARHKLTTGSTAGHCAETGRRVNPAAAAAPLQPPRCCTSPAEPSFAHTAAT